MLRVERRTAKTAQRQQSGANDRLRWAAPPMPRSPVGETGIGEGQGTRRDRAQRAQAKPSTRARPEHAGAWATRQLRVQQPHQRDGSERVRDGVGHPGGHRDQLLGWRRRRRGCSERLRRRHRLLWRQRGDQLRLVGDHGLRRWLSCALVHGSAHVAGADNRERHEVDSACRRAESGRRGAGGGRTDRPS